MANYILVNKRSKKAQAAYHKQFRIVWGSMNPASRIIPSKKKKSKTRWKSTGVGLPE